MEYLDPMPCLVMWQFEGEKPSFVPGGAAILTQLQMERIIELILFEVNKRKKSCVLSWEEASDGHIKRYACKLDPK